MIVKCEFCKFYNRYEGKTGTCKRFPPQMIRSSFFKWEYGHPKTYPNDYCGEGVEDSRDFPQQIKK